MVIFMFEQVLNEVYNKFKMQFYQKVFTRFENREASLTTVETFCVETIYALGQPTINEFASFAGISPPNAAYKVNSLIKKGYLQKRQSTVDKREYHLEVTQKFHDYYNISYHYLEVVAERVRQRCTAEEICQFEHMLSIISNELMPEIPPLCQERPPVA